MERIGHKGHRSYREPKTVIDMSVGFSCDFYLCRVSCAYTLCIELSVSSLTVKMGKLPVYPWLWKIPESSAQLTLKTPNLSRASMRFPIPSESSTFHRSRTYFIISGSGDGSTNEQIVLVWGDLFRKYWLTKFLNNVKSKILYMLSGSPLIFSTESKPFPFLPLSSALHEDFKVSNYWAGVTSTSDYDVYSIFSSMKSV